MKVRVIPQKQALIMNWWSNNSFHNCKNGIICDGAIKTGKSYYQGISFVLWSMAKFNKRDFVICGKTVASVRRNVINSLTARLKILKFDIKENKELIVIKKGKIENYYHIIGLRDESSLSKVVSMNLAGALFDEVVLLERFKVEQVMARCSIMGAKWWFNCRPESPYHWFYQEYILKAYEKNLLYINLGYKDILLNDELKERYTNLYSGEFKERFIYGKWVCADGLVYYMFDENKHIREFKPTNNFVKYYISCDYGTINPFSLGLWACEYDDINPIKFTMYRIKEFYHSSRDVGIQLTDEEYYQKLKELAKGYGITAIVLDPTCASFIETIKRHNEFKTIKASADVNYGINKVANAFWNMDLFIAPNCTNILREISSYKWQSGKYGDMPVKANDHALDDMRYFVSEMVNSRND